MGVSSRASVLVGRKESIQRLIFFAAQASVAILQNARIVAFRRLFALL